MNGAKFIENNFWYQTWVKSISAAQRKTKSSVVNLIIADNSTEYHEFNTTDYDNIKIQHTRLDNVGYLGGAMCVLNDRKDILEYDYVIISNVDILMNDDFLYKLENLKIQSDVAWIAPSIQSHLIGRDKNPSVLTRYPKWKLILLKYTYNKYILPLYEKLYYNKRNSNIKCSEMDIYAGHGSFFLLTRSYFNCNKKIDYPIFLYGEELYFGEMIRKSNMKVRYVPELVINDFEHVSTSQISRNTYYSYNKAAISYILERFY